jgi:hypothetical protein
MSVNSRTWMGLLKSMSKPLARIPLGLSGLSGRVSPLSTMLGCRPMITARRGRRHGRRIGAVVDDGWEASPGVGDVKVLVASLLASVLFKVLNLSARSVKDIDEGK